MIHFNLTYRVLPGMQLKDVSVACFPDTLQISRHPSGHGLEVQIDDSDHSKRLWFVSEIVEVQFGAERVAPMIA